MSEKQIGPLDVEEIKVVRFEFVAELAPTATLSSAAVAVTLTYGTDAAPAGLLVGSPLIQGTDVLQQVTGVGRTVGATYHLRARVVDDSGNTHVVAADLPVKRL